MNTIKYCFIMILLSFGVISCSSNKRMEKSKDSKFSWMPTMAAPYNYL